MKALKEISSDTYLYIEFASDEISILDKGSFVETFSEEEAKELEKVAIAEKVNIRCDLEEWIEYICEEYAERVYNDITEEEREIIENIINKAIDRNPSFEIGEEIDITDFIENKECPNLGQPKEKMFLPTGQVIFENNKIQAKCIAGLDLAKDKETNSIDEFIKKLENRVLFLKGYYLLCKSKEEKEKNLCRINEVNAIIKIVKDMA